jgi:hypothetical protein
MTEAQRLELMLITEVPQAAKDLYAREMARSMGRYLRRGKGWRELWPGQGNFPSRKRGQPLKH